MKIRLFSRRIKFHLKHNFLHYPSPNLWKWNPERGLSLQIKKQGGDFAIPYFMLVPSSPFFPPDPIFYCEKIQQKSNSSIHTENQKNDLNVIFCNNFSRDHKNRNVKKSQKLSSIWKNVYLNKNKSITVIISSLYGYIRLASFSKIVILLLLCSIVTLGWRNLLWKNNDWHIYAHLSIWMKKISNLLQRMPHTTSNKG